MSEEDADAVEKLDRELTKYGFNCRKYPDDEIKSLHDINGKTIVVICSPKVDMNTGLVLTNDKSIGGNTLSSMIYKEYSSNIGIEILPKEIKAHERKQYYLTKTDQCVISPMDHGAEKKKIKIKH